MSPPPWRASLGALPEEGLTRFRVWAPQARAVEVVLGEGAGRRRVPLAQSEASYFSGRVEGLGADDLYRIALDGRGPFPDPAARFLPHGVHGPSQVVDASSFPWNDAGWRGLTMDRAVFYELHVGAFTNEGTFAAAARALPALRDLGVTVVELMPVAAFPGARGWGYDGAALFAPAACYGTPEELRRLVDAAHRLEMAVVLDVVYNHLGPDGAYAVAFAPGLLARERGTPWGAAVNLDGPGAREVRDFLIENALHWIHEYHLDGLRLDATHALPDASPRHFLAELSERVEASVTGREVLLVAEDERNLAPLVRPRSQGGWGMDAVWADDFHHQMRRRLVGDRDGYYADYSGSTADLAATLRQGWLYTGQRSRYRGAPRGTDPSGLWAPRFVFCVQNHDQVGNRALGERLHHQVPAAAWRAAVALLLLAPQTPLLFMGQEWSASAPFLFFSDHGPELGPRVTEGRRAEFRRFRAFSDPEARARIPDPQDPGTFERSKLRWEERAEPGHAGVLRLHRALLALRRELAVPAPGAAACEARALDEATVALARPLAAGGAVLAVVRLEGPGTVHVPAALLAGAGGPGAWSVWLTSEDEPFAENPRPPVVAPRGEALEVRFSGPAALVLRRA